MKRRSESQLAPGVADPLVRRGSRTNDPASRGSTGREAGLAAADDHGVKVLRVVHVFPACSLHCVVDGPELTWGRRGRDPEGTERRHEAFLEERPVRLRLPRPRSRANPMGLGPATWKMPPPGLSRPRCADLLVELLRPLGVVHHHCDGHVRLLCSLATDEHASGGEHRPASRGSANFKRSVVILDRGASNQVALERERRGRGSRGHVGLPKMFCMCRATVCSLTTSSVAISRFVFRSRPGAAPAAHAG